MQMGKERGGGEASKFRPSEMVSDAIVMVGAENLTCEVIIYARISWDKM